MRRINRRQLLAPPNIKIQRMGPKVSDEFAYLLPAADLER
jgi:hypothetical protein